jgi:hypothetical protein
MLGFEPGPARTLAAKLGKMKRLGCAGLVLVSLLCASRAHAQDEEPERARVVLDGGTPTMELRLTRQKSDETLLRCEGRCAFIAPVGRYRVFARDPSTGAEYELGLRVKRSGEFRLRQGDSTAQMTGLALGITGPFLFASGVVAVFTGAMSNNDSRTKIGLGLMAVGAAVTPVGWVVYAQNRTKLELLDQDASAPARFRVGLSVAPGALGVAGVARF